MVIKAFNREQDTIEEFDATNQKLYESAWKSQFLSGMMQPIMMFVGNLGYAAVALMRRSACYPGNDHRSEIFRRLSST